MIFKQEKMVETVVTNVDEGKKNVENAVDEIKLANEMYDDSDSTVNKICLGVVIIVIILIIMMIILPD
jgi:t-SNARE complex subunit (syntaxin)